MTAVCCGCTYSRGSSGSGGVAAVDTTAITALKELNPLYGKKVACLGDSLCYGQSFVGGYCTILAETEPDTTFINKGVGAYEVVATDYGYHIMLCTSVITAGNELASKEAFLSDVEKEGTLAYKFKEYKYNLITSSTITKITNTIINTFKNDEKIVTYNKSTYDELIPEEEEK